MADEWPSNIGDYGRDPVTTLDSKLLGYLDVGPKSYEEHIKESEERGVPFESSAIDRADAAYDKARDFYDRTSLGEEDGSIKRALGLALVLGAGSKHQWGQGIQNFSRGFAEEPWKWRNPLSKFKSGLLSGRTSDNWAPNFIDWVSGSRAVLDRHFGWGNQEGDEFPEWDPNSKIYIDQMSHDK